MRARSVLLAVSALLGAAAAAAQPAGAPTAPPVPAAPPAPAASASGTPAAPPIALRWTAPAGCPDEAALAARIERLLGGPPRAGDHHLEATGEVEATGNGYRLQLTLASGTSESTRVLPGASCDTVTDAGALLIALAFDPDAVAAEEQKRAEAGAAVPAATASPAATAAPVAPASATPVVRIPVPVPSAPPAPPAPSVALSFGGFAALAGDAGSMPGVAPGLRVGLSLGIDAYRIEPAFVAWPSSRSTLADRPDAGAELRLLAFALSACRRVLPWTRAEPPAPGLAGLAALACLGFEVGEMRGTGFGVVSPASAGALWAAPLAELRAELPLATWLSLSLGAGLAVPLDRRRFVLDLAAGRTLVHEPSPVAGRASLGAALRF